MLPFARLIAPGFADPSPPGSWTCTADGGTSYLFGTRSWYGRDDDGNGYSYVYLPIATARGGLFRLSFRTGSQRVSYGNGSGQVWSASPGLVQLDFRKAANAPLTAFLRTDATVDTVVDAITLEQLG